MAFNVSYHNWYINLMLKKYQGKGPFVLFGLQLGGAVAFIFYYYCV